MKTLRSLILMGACFVAACGPQPGYTTSSPGAAVGAAGLAIAATGVHRALTGDCWARCSKGWACNRASGLCEQSECQPGCSPTERCVRLGDDRLECVPEGLAFGGGVHHGSSATTANSTPSAARPGTGTPTPPSSTLSNPLDPPLPSGANSQ